METKAKSTATTHLINHMLSFFHDFNLNNNSNNTPTSSTSLSSFSPALQVKRTKAPSLLSLCIGVIGKHLEDLIPDLGEVAISFPADIKIAIAAIARRKKLLNDEVILLLADDTWEILDISSSDVSDFGLAKIAEMCTLRAVDISRCRNITPDGVARLVQLCPSLETLRCGGCPRSDFTARRSLGLFKPALNSVEEDSWEELDTAKITDGGDSLRWIVWPKIGPEFLEDFSSECPRIKINPQPSPFGFKRAVVPREAFPDIVLDDPIIEDIDPSTWASFGRPSRILVQPFCSPDELSMAEKFRLAFEERDTRLAPKRAKNARQHQRRAGKEWRLMTAEGKAVSLASQATKILRGRN
ncbi:uncharacterized protein LOC141626378 [Silene latifolia]|uniref:uncharacterized protein LOC141626378 n=1 Tax=Silene latifolia TaxID=37657 RepID=UPI003D778AB6